MANNHRSRPAVSTMVAFLTLAGNNAKQNLAVVTLLFVAFTWPATGQSDDQNHSPNPPSPDSRAHSQPASNSSPDTVTIPAGTRIALVLTHPILSRSIHHGDDIYAQINSPVSSGDEVVIPPGSFVQGKVDKLERKGGRGELHLQSMSITFPNGYVSPLTGPATLESGDGYALKDPGKGRFIGAFALPGAGLGLGALIGHAASNSQGTTTTVTLPPNCGVPTPGCTNGTSQTFTTPPNRLKSTAIGSMVGLAVGGVASLALLTSSHNFFLDVGSPVEMVLQQPVSLEREEVTGAVRQSQEHPAPEQPPPSIPNHRPRHRTTTPAFAIPPERPVRRTSTLQEPRPSATRQAPLAFTSPASRRLRLRRTRVPGQPLNRRVRLLGGQDRRGFFSELSAQTHQRALMKSTHKCLASEVREPKFTAARIPKTMPTLIPQPTRIQSAGNRPKLIDEYIGRVNSKTSATSVAHMRSPAGWVEPGQTPEFDEFTVVLKGALRVEYEKGYLDVAAGQAVIACAGEWVRYSTPQEGGAEYIAICLPAFSMETVHRD